MRGVVLVCVLLAGCATVRLRAPSACIELTILDTRGFPIEHAVVFANGQVYLVEGWTLRFDGVTRPLVIQAYKPGYAPSHPRAFRPGEPAEIRLWKVSRLD